MVSDLDFHNLVLFKIMVIKVDKHFRDRPNPHAPSIYARHAMRERERERSELSKVNSVCACVNNGFIIVQENLFTVTTNMSYNHVINHLKGKENIASYLLPTNCLILDQKITKI